MDTSFLTPLSLLFLLCTSDQQQQKTNKLCYNLQTFLPDLIPISPLVSEREMKM